MAALLSLAMLAVVAAATIFDVITAVYFRTLSNECDGDGHLSDDECYCTDSQGQFNRIFQDVGSMRCDNLFAQDTGYLVANAVLSGLCALIALSITLSFIMYFFCSVCGCTKPRYSRV